MNWNIYAWATFTKNGRWRIWKLRWNMATPKKLPSGRWRIRVFLGKDSEGRLRYRSITADTKKEAVQAARAAERTTEKDARQGLKSARSATIGEAVDKYIELCRPLSPATISGYDKIRRTAFPDLWDVPVDDFDDLAAQDAINREAMREGRRGRISPKTLANEWMLVSAALARICHKRFEVRLPAKQRRMQDYPEPVLVLSALRGSSIELPCLLAMWCGLRMSEIRGLIWDDLQGDVLRIRRVVVDVDGAPVEKSAAKTYASRRLVLVPPQVLDLLAAAPHVSDHIVPLTHDQIYGRFRRLMDPLGISITFHDLRHYFASIGVLAGISDLYIQQSGGWSSDSVMKSVYFNTFTSGQRDAFDRRNRFMEDLLFQLETPQKYDTKYDTWLGPVEKSSLARGSIPLGSTKTKCRKRLKK